MAVLGHFPRTLAGNLPGDEGEFAGTVPYHEISCGREGLPMRTTFDTSTPHRQHLGERRLVTRSVDCPRCGALAGRACIGVGECKGAEVRIHHIQRMAVAHPGAIDPLPYRAGS